MEIEERIFDPLMCHVMSNAVSQIVAEERKASMSDYVEELKEAPSSNMKKASRLVRGHR